jgi:F420-non-reducing hydrogenase large subunit
MSRRITIDPITRLEGHGRIEIFTDGEGNVENTHLQIPDFKGFEKFCEGRAVEEMPTLTQKICGVCPIAHHTASSKALDEIFSVEPPVAARKIRELMYNAFIFEDHLLHFYFLGGPDFIVGLDSSTGERNVLGVIDKLGAELGKRMIDMRKRVRGINATIGGSPLYPVCGLPGGVSKALTREEIAQIRGVTKDAVEFSKLTLKIFDETFLKSKAYLDLLHSDALRHRTYYMGLVDEKSRMNFYDGKIRVVGPDGEELVKFVAKDYLKYLEERVEPWSYAKILYLKEIGWKGYTDGTKSGIYRVGPLARLNVSEGMKTPSAQAEYERMFDSLGGRPAHHTLAYHWARLIEVLCAAERMDELARDEDLASTAIRNLPHEINREGVGVCEAPRGTLFHHYKTDERGIIEEMNLLVATQNNAGAICLSVDKAARVFIKGRYISESIKNRIEVAFRAYDPCLACTTHVIAGPNR